MAVMPGLHMCCRIQKKKSSSFDFNALPLGIKLGPKACMVPGSYTENHCFIATAASSFFFFSLTQTLFLGPAIHAWILL